MTVAEFCRSEYGRGLNQQKLYRRVRRFAEEEWPQAVAPPFDTYYFQAEGLQVGRRKNGDRRHEVTNPESFREWALGAAGWTQPSDPEEVRALLEGARLLARIAREEDADWELIERRRERVGGRSSYSDAWRRTGREALSMDWEKRRLIERLEEIAERHLPPSVEEERPGPRH